VRAAIYVRVSTPGQAQEGESIAMQKERLSSYAKAQGWKIYKIYEDAGYSGGSTDRPAFQKMMEDAQDKKFDVLLVYKIDRLSRSILDFHTTLKILQDNGISFVSLTQNFDTSTSMGRLMLAILVDFANFEREINVDRSKDSYLNRLNHGYHSGKTPFGYKRENGNNLVIDEEQAEVVRQIFDMALGSYTSREIADKFHLGVSKIKNILNNPIYAGYVCDRGKYGRKIPPPDKWIKGQHKPIIPLETFLNVMKKWKHGPKKTTYVGLFQKLIYCPYDKHNFSLEVRKLKKGQRFLYWCAPVRRGETTCNRRFSEELIENLVLRSIEKSNLSALYEKKTAEKQVNVKKEVEKIDKKIKRYINLLEYQDIPVVQVKEKLRELQEKRKDVLRSANTAQDKEVLHYLKTINELYPYMTRKEKQRLWRITIKRITLYKSTFKIEWKNGLITQGSLTPNPKFGTEGGTYIRNLSIERSIRKVFRKLSAV
jgi:site-specific DNA recombinase